MPEIVKKPPADGSNGVNGAGSGPKKKQKKTTTTTTTNKSSPKVPTYLHGVEVTPSVAFGGWQAGFEYTKNICLNNLNTKSVKVTYE